MSLFAQPNQSPEPTAVGAVSSAIAVHVAELVATMDTKVITAYIKQLERELDQAIADKRRMDWLCDKSKVYAICIQTQPHGETIHGELRAAIDAAAQPNIRS